MVPTGRIKCGTESNGGFKNITISNCVFDNCRGFALETVDGAILEDITFIGITMRDIRNSPIFLRLGTRMRGPKGVRWARCGASSSAISSVMARWRSCHRLSAAFRTCIEDIKVAMCTFTSWVEGRRRWRNCSRWRKTTTIRSRGSLVRCRPTDSIFDMSRTSSFAMLRLSTRSRMSGLLSGCRMWMGRISSE